jgi:anti-sigma factor RsiW
MDCDRLREVLIDHVDGLLGRDEAEAARLHLAACGECRRLQEEVRRNFAALDAWEDEELPAGAYERLVKRLPAGPVPRVVSAPASAPAGTRRWMRLAVPYAAGLATAAAAVGIFVVPRGAPAPAAPSASPVPAPTAVPDPVAVNSSTPSTPALRPGERALVFRDVDNGVVRKYFVPGDVNLVNLEVETEEVPVVFPPGGVR